VSSAPPAASHEEQRDSAEHHRGDRPGRQADYGTRREAAERCRNRRDPGAARDREEHGGSTAIRVGIWRLLISLYLHI
jgi:hypothetical protein